MFSMIGPLCTTILPKSYMTVEFKYRPIK